MYMLVIPAVNQLWYAAAKKEGHNGLYQRHAIITFRKFINFNMKTPWPLHSEILYLTRAINLISHYWRCWRNYLFSFIRQSFPFLREQSDKCFSKRDRTSFFLRCTRISTFVNLKYVTFVSALLVYDAQIITVIRGCAVQRPGLCVSVLAAIAKKSDGWALEELVVRPRVTKDFPPVLICCPLIPIASLTKKF